MSWSGKMKSKYAYRGLNYIEQSIINRENKIECISPRTYKEWSSDEEMRLDMKYHIKHRQSYGNDDPCISLTSSISVARFHAKYENNNNVAVINMNQLDKRKLMKATTTTLFYGNDLHGDYDDIRRDGYPYKTKEYVYGDRINEFSILPKWLEEFIYYYRNVRGEIDKVCINKINEAQEFYNNDDFSDVLFKLYMLYINDNYDSFEDLYNENKLLILNNENRAQIKYLSNVNYNYIKDKLHDTFNFIEENSLVIKRRKEIENIIDDFMNSPEKFSIEYIKDRIPNLNIMRIFFYEYYKNNKTMKEIYNLFIKEGFVNDCESKELCELIGRVQFKILNCLGKDYNNIEYCYTLYDYMNKIPVDTTEGYLKLININTKGYDPTKLLTENIIIDDKNEKEDRGIDWIPLNIDDIDSRLFNNNNINDYYSRNVKQYF